MAAYSRPHIKDELQGNPFYKRVQGISRGDFGFVDVYFHLQMKEHMAVKFIERGDRITKNIQRQVLQHLELVHPHVVQIHEVLLTNSYLAIVMEYMVSGSLLAYARKRGPMAEDEAQWYFQQLALAVDYLHRKEVASRDIKMEHIMMHFQTGKRPLIKLTGVGCSKHERYDLAPWSLQRALTYIAPEAIHAGGLQMYDGKASDVWAMGIILFRMVVGGFPFGEDIQEHSKRAVHMYKETINNARYELPAHRECSSDLKNILAGLLDPNPDTRLTTSQVLEHPFFLGDLPVELTKMNDGIMAKASLSQSVHDVRLCLEQAKHALPDHERLVWDPSNDDHQFQSLERDEVLDLSDSITGNDDSYIAQRNSGFNVPILEEA